MHFLPFLFAKDCSTSFLGLNSWYHYLKLDDNCDIKSFNVFPPHSDIPLVLLALVDDLLRIAGIVAVAFVIVGAISLMTSEGNPDKTAKARDTIINSLVGVIIAAAAIGLVSYLGRRLG